MKRAAEEVKCIIDTSLVKVENRKATILRTLHKNHLVAFNMQVTQFDAHVSGFHSTAMKHTAEWIYPFNDFKCMSWVTPRRSRAWEDVHKSLEFMIRNKIIRTETGLFDE